MRDTSGIASAFALTSGRLGGAHAAAFAAGSSGGLAYDEIAASKHAASAGGGEA